MASYPLAPPVYAQPYNPNGGAISIPTPQKPPVAPSVSSTPPVPATKSQAANTASSLGGTISSIWGILTGNVENGVFVVLGLLLIAAGVFSFKTTQNVIETGSKIATVAG